MKDRRKGYIDKTRSALRLAGLTVYLVEFDKFAAKYIEEDFVGDSNTFGTLCNAIALDVLDGGCNQEGVRALLLLSGLDAEAGRTFFGEDRVNLAESLQRESFSFADVNEMNAALIQDLRFNHLYRSALELLKSEDAEALVSFLRSFTPSKADDREIIRAVVEQLLRFDVTSGSSTEVALRSLATSRN